MKSSKQHDPFYLHFSSPVLDTVGISSIFGASASRLFNPIPRDDQRKTRVIFSYDPPFSKLVFNYSKTLKGIDTIVALNRALNVKRDCQ